MKKCLTMNITLTITQLSASDHDDLPLNISVERRIIPFVRFVITFSGLVDTNTRR